jgi:ABC-type Na+ efflux pump permease subunit
MEGIVMLGPLSGLLWLVSLICGIIVIVRMFQTAGVVQGILGLLCGLWAFIWGWMNVDKVGRNVMVLWTIAIILASVFGYSSGFYFGFDRFR